MPTPEWFVFGIIVPALGSAALFALIALARWRRPGSPLLPVGAAVTLALAYVAGHWAQGSTGNWPRFPPAEALDWITLALLPIGALAAVLTAMPRRCAWMAWAVRGCGSVALVVLVLLPLVRDQRLTWLEKIAALDGVCVLVGGGWLGMAALAREQPSAAMPVVLGMIAAAMGMLLLLMYDWAVAAHHALTFGAALGGVALVGLLWRGRHGAAGVVDIAAVVLGGILVSGPYYTSETPLHALVLGMAPLLMWVGMLPCVRDWKPWQRGLTQVFLVGLPTAAVVGDAAVTFLRS